MNHWQLQEELSAYLDGEAGDPDAVRQLIEHDPDAARLFNEMKRLSGRVAALPEPEVPAQFLTRVMAGLRLERQPRAWRFTTAFAAFAAMAAILLGAALFRSELRGRRAAGPWARPETSAAFPYLNSWLLADEALFDTQAEWDHESGPNTNAVASTDAWLGAFAQEEWFPSFAWSVESEADIDALLSSLTERESETLKTLLLEYAEEEFST